MVTCVDETCNKTVIIMDFSQSFGVMLNIKQTCASGHGKPAKAQQNGRQLGTNNNFLNPIEPLYRLKNIIYAELWLR